MIKITEDTKEEGKTMSKKTTTEDSNRISDIKNRLNQSSKKWEWEYYFHAYSGWGCYFGINGVMYPKRGGSMKDTISISSGDATFIANARKDIEYLLSLIGRL